MKSHAPKKPGKQDMLRDSLGGAATRADEPAVDRSGYQKSSQATISFRIDTADRSRLERFAQDRGLKLAQLVRAWVLERAKQEGLR